jgi:hypothetical protein
MLLAVTIVLGGFALLHFAVSSEERGLEQDNRTPKR